MGRSPDSLRGIHVLLVDDNEDARDILAVFLGHHGALVTAVPSAAAALERLEVASPDVIVSDIAMPGMTGHEFMRCVRARPDEAQRSTPALALTAFPGERTRALENGFQSYLAKPADPDRVVDEVARLAAGQP